MIKGVDLDSYVHKNINLKTSNNMYVRIDDVNEKNHLPILILTPQRSLASEFMFIKKSETSIVIRLNNDMKNQNNTFGYHLYVIPESDLIFGSGNDELFAQFNLEKKDQFVMIKSSYKGTYLSHEYDVLRNRPFDQKWDKFLFSIEEIHIPFVQRNICIISFGYLSRQVNLTNSPIINTLKDIYPQSTIDLYMFLPETLDEFYNIQINPKLLQSPKCMTFVKTHNNNIDHFIKLAHSYGMPMISSTHKNYSFRTISLLWNMTESIKMFLETKKVYNTYIMMRNDMFANANVLKKILDCNKLYCLNNNSIDNHIFIGKDILQFSYLFDFFVKNKTTYLDETPERVMNDFLSFHNVRLGDIHHMTPFIDYPSNAQIKLESFFKNVISKYKELFGNICSN
jgi:hypothetical protein